MKEQIINILREHPGLRKREIAGYLCIHHFKIISLLDEMEQEGAGGVYGLVLATIAVYDGHVCGRGIFS